MFYLTRWQLPNSEFDNSGGYTVLGLAGAIYNIDLMQAYCSSATYEIVERTVGWRDLARNSDRVMQRLFAVDYSSASEILHYKDPRWPLVLGRNGCANGLSLYSKLMLGKHFAMAPAVGPGITVAAKSLQGIDQAVALIAAADDEVVNPQLGAVRIVGYAKHIPDAELVLLPSGGHFRTPFEWQCHHTAGGRLVYRRYSRICGVASSTLTVRSCAAKLRTMWLAFSLNIFRRRSKHGITG